MEESIAEKFKEVRRQCLDKGILLLTKETVPTEETAKTVETLIGIAAMINSCSFQWKD